MGTALLGAQDTRVCQHVDSMQAPHTAPCLPTVSHRRGPGHTSWRTRMPQTQDQGDKILIKTAIPAAAHAWVTPSGAKPGAGTPAWPGRTTGQSVWRLLSQAGPHSLLTAVAFLPETVFPGSALLLPQKQRAASPPPRSLVPVEPPLSTKQPTQGAATPGTHTALRAHTAQHPPTPGAPTEVTLITCDLSPNPDLCRPAA